MATLFGVIAIGVFVLLMVAGRNKLAARTQDHVDSGRDGID
ncbi:MAG TPA: hypothetical protein VJV39_11980 [Dongiaceae bacterium]|nr:hypothetical protein [Dongiaceae bacterium]